MPTFVVRRTIAASPARVFDWLADVRRYTASPVVLSARWAQLDDQGGHGVGAVREVTAAIGWFRERIVASEPGRELRYQILASVPPVRHEYGAVVLTEVPGGTHVEWTTTTAVRLPLAGPVLDRIVLGRAIQVGFGDVLRACERELTA